MNQILLTENQKSNKKIKYNANNSVDIKKIVIFFAITILIFAILIIGVYVYKMSKNSKHKDTIAKPTLSLEQTENKLNIIIEAEAGISKIIYTWNDDEPVEIEMNGRKSNEESLDIPEGHNTITVKVIDEEGQEIETKQNFYIEESNEKPKIEIDESEEMVRNGKIKIIAEDNDNSIKYITYKWNDEQENIIEAEDDNQTVLETEIYIKRGKNTLTITAVNGKAKSQTIQKNFEGVNKPVVDVIRDNNIIYMKITHDMGLKKVEFTINGQEYIYDENYSGYDPEQEEIQYKFELVEGENLVTIHAISNEEVHTLDGTKNTEYTYEGRCDYIPEE